MSLSTVITPSIFAAFVAAAPNHDLLRTPVEPARDEGRCFEGGYEHEAPYCLVRCVGDHKFTVIGGPEDEDYAWCSRAARGYCQWLRDRDLDRWCWGALETGIPYDYDE